jgi:hypothetical protein
MEWSNEPNVLPDNETYAKLSPDEVAKAVTEAYSKQDWDEMRKFLPNSFVDEMKTEFESSTKADEPKREHPICEVTGKAFWSDEQSAYFVKCRVSGQFKKWDLAIRNDNPAKRYMFDGGI